MPTTTINERAALHNLEAERALLGSILLDNGTLPVAQVNLGRNDLYSEAHRMIFAVMEQLQENKQTIDLVTLSDALAVRHELEKAGGAGYLAALTDGVPIGTAAPAKEYCRIIQQRAMQRKIVENAQNLLARAENGIDNPEDLIQIMCDQATDLHRTYIGNETLETVREINEKAETALYKDFPVMPSQAWYGAAEIYRQAVQVSTNASHNYHLAAFLTVVGLLFGKSIVTEEAGDEYFPNLFTVVVGRAGAAHKDTAVNKAVKLAKTLDENIIFVPKIASWEGFVCGLQAEQKELEKKQITPPLRIIIRLRELKSLIAKAAQKATSNVMSELCELYDVPDELTSPTKNDRAIVKQPIAAVIASTSPKWLRQLQLDDLEAGVGSRFIFTPGDPGPRLKKRRKPLPEFMNPLQSMLAQRVSDFRNLGKTVFEFTDRAKERIENWAEAHESKLSGNELIDCLTARDEANCRKIALIHAATDSLRPVIDIQHVEAAIAYVEFLYESRFPVFAGQGMTPGREIDEKILKRVQKASSAGIPYREVRRGIQEISYEEFERHMRSLLQGNDPPLTVRKVGKSLRVWTAYTIKGTSFEREQPSRPE